MLHDGKECSTENCRRPTLLANSVLMIYPVITSYPIAAHIFVCHRCTGVDLRNRPPPWYQYDVFIHAPLPDLQFQAQHFFSYSIWWSSEKERALTRIEKPSWLRAAYVKINSSQVEWQSSKNCTKISPTQKPTYTIYPLWLIPTPRRKMETKLFQNEAQQLDTILSTSILTHIFYSPN